MPRYVIERQIPGAGQLSPTELRVISQKSVGIISGLGPGLTWIQSFVADDKIYCIFDAPDMEVIHEHARCMGIPASHIAEVFAMIDPSTANG